MSGQTGQSLATFLLSVPVAAIGLMAVFGIPQFAAVIAAQRGAGDDSEGDPFDNEFDALPSEESSLFGNHDPTFPRDDARGNGETAPRWGAPRQGLPETSMPEGRAPRPNDVWGDRNSEFNSNDGSPDDSGLQAPDPWGNSQAAATPSLTWSEARRQLAELGVDDFHLEAGAVPDTFTFIAVFSPGDQREVTYRFEAEASDPLLAVEDVVAQIEDWLADRFASTGQYRSANFASRPDRRW